MLSEVGQDMAEDHACGGFAQLAPQQGGQGGAKVGPTGGGEVGEECGRFAGYKACGGYLAHPCGSWCGGW
jgi:hypothetical protein